MHRGLAPAGYWMVKNVVLCRIQHLERSIIDHHVMPRLGHSYIGLEKMAGALVHPSRTIGKIGMIVTIRKEAVRVLRFRVSFEKAINSVCIKIKEPEPEKGKYQEPELC
ncbi:hypothetical protein ACQKKK_09090 [Peribacillus sp. NPDC006672]|uniref:hypothetical protein n=1 Tax=Peribacillus sp. NPDC006672 TaxID=3390606 RepID=UPI003D020E73